MRGGDWACSVSDQVSQESGDRTAHYFEPDFSGPSVVDRDLIDLLGRFVELWTRSEYRRTAIRRKLPVRKCEVFLRRTKEEQKDGGGIGDGLACSYPFLFLFAKTWYGSWD